MCIKNESLTLSRKKRKKEKRKEEEEGKTFNT